MPEMAAGSRGSSVQEPLTRGSSRGLPVPAPPAGKRELLRAKRKLHFKGNVFEGERFYLDLDGYNNTKQLETDLYEMGAFVERFFNKQVSKIITNKKEGNHNRGNSSSSSLSRLSSTRAAALLSKSIASSKNCNNMTIQEKAKKMGIKTVQLIVILDIISREKDRASKPEDLVNEGKTCPMSAPRARKLRAPYIKVEDDSCTYRPVCSSFTKFPLVDLSNLNQNEKKVENRSVPKLDLNKENQEKNNRLSTVNVEAKPKEIGKGINDSKIKPTKRAHAGKPKNGYCEMCDTFFNDLKEHTKYEGHNKVVQNKEFWSTLDEVINTLPNLDSLISNLRQSQDAKKVTSKHPSCSDVGDVSEDSVHLVTDGEGSGSKVQHKSQAMAKRGSVKRKEKETEEHISLESTEVKSIFVIAQESNSVIVIGDGETNDPDIKPKMGEGSIASDDKCPVIAPDTPHCLSERKEINNNVKGSKSVSQEPIETVPIPVESEHISTSSIPIDTSILATDAIFGSKTFGSDRSVAREIEDGLEALLECASNITLQQQSQPSEHPASGGRSSNHSNQARISTTHLKSTTHLNSTTDLKSSVEKCDGTVSHYQLVENDSQKKDALYSGIATPKEGDTNEDNILGISELSNENFIFSSLSLVENDYVNSMALNELNQEGLSVLSEIAERYGVPSLLAVDAGVTNIGNDLMQESTNQLYSLDTASMVNHAVSASHFNEISSTVLQQEKTVLPMDEDCVQHVLDKENLVNNDFSDLSEASVNNPGLACDTFLTIMNTLDCSEASQAIKEATSMMIKTGTILTGKSAKEPAPDQESSPISSPASVIKNKKDVISMKLDEILKCVVSHKVDSANQHSCAHRKSGEIKKSRTGSASELPPSVDLSVNDQSRNCVANSAPDVAGCSFDKTHQTSKVLMKMTFDNESSNNELCQSDSKIYGALHKLAGENPMPVSAPLDDNTVSPPSSENSISVSVLSSGNPKSEIPSKNLNSTLEPICATSHLVPKPPLVENSDSVLETPEENISSVPPSEASKPPSVNWTSKLTNNTDSISELPSDRSYSMSEMPSDNTDSISELPSDNPNSISELPTDNPNSISELPTDNPNSISELPSDNPDSISELPSDNPNSISELLSDNPDTISELPTDNPNSISELPSDNPDSISELPSDNPDSISELPSDNPDSISELPSDNPNSISELPSDNFDSVLKPYSENTNSVSESNSEGTNPMRLNKNLNSVFDPPSKNQNSLPSTDNSDSLSSSYNPESLSELPSDNPDSDSTLCYGESLSESDSTPTKAEQPENSYVPSQDISDTDSHELVTISSSQPHNEDACDGMSECLTEYDVQSTGGSYHSTIATETHSANEQSLSLGYHSYSPLEDSLEADIVPLGAMRNDRLRLKEVSTDDTQNPVLKTSKLPKPFFSERKPIKLRINLKKKQCTLLNLGSDFISQGTVDSRTEPLVGNQKDCELVHGSCAPPTALKLKFAKMRTPKSTPKLPVSFFENTRNPTAGQWSVNRSGVLKLKFSSSSKLYTPPKHRPEYSPRSEHDGRPSKRRRKLTYEPGTLRW